MLAGLGPNQLVGLTPTVLRLDASAFQGVQAVDRGGDGLPGTHHGVLIGGVVEAQALDRVLTHVGAKETHLRDLGVLGGVGLLPRQVGLHGDLLGDIPLHEVVGFAGQGAYVLQLGAHEADLVRAGDLGIGNGVPDGGGQAGGVVGGELDDGEDALVAGGDLRFQDRGADGLDGLGDLSDEGLGGLAGRCCRDKLEELE